MPLTTRACLLVVLAGACGDDAALEDANALALSESQRVELCQRREDSLKSMNQALGTIACTTAAHEEGDCEAARDACVAKIIPLDFDTCSTREAREHALQVLQANLAPDPELAAVLDNQEPVSVKASCTVKVKTLLACNDANDRLFEQAAAGYTCSGGEELIEFAPPEVCVRWANEVRNCTGENDG